MNRKNQSFKYPVIISGVVESVIKSLGLTHKYNGWLTVNRWPEIVGEHIARISRAVRFEDGILYVAVPDASWRQNLAMEIDNILEKIRQYPYGRVVKQIRLVRGEKGNLN
ncbi:MAG: DUF721 domain-containing protein [Candidatus Zixiibacteriota bacterium]